MAKKKEHWIKSPWSVSLGTAVFSLNLTMIYDYFKSKPFLTTIWTIIKSVVNFIWAFLNYDLKVWWVITGIALFILVIIILDKLKNIEIKKPFYYNYKEDKFKHWKWSWDWELDSESSSWMIVNLKAHCPSCSTPLINSSNGLYGLNFSCPRCNFSARFEDCDDAYNVQCVIHNNIDRQIAERQNNK